MMSICYRFVLVLCALMSVSLLSGAAHAMFAEDNIPGQPVDWQLGLQLPATPVMQQLYDLHDFLNIIILAISVFVLGLLVWVMMRYNAKSNPVPSKTSHNTFIEIIWTAVPVMILVVIAIPTLKVLYFMDKAEDPDMTLKVIGHQWYWTYEYPDHGITFQSYMKPDNELLPGEPRLLAVDNRVVVPVDTTVQVLITAADVNHNWAIPAFGIKKDAIPGHVNETWFHVTEPGIYYGQCSELCGVRHGFMPIAVEVVERPVFDRWVEQAKLEFASDPSAVAAPVVALGAETAQ